MLKNNKYIFEKAKYEKTKSLNRTPIIHTFNLKFNYQSAVKINKIDNYKRKFSHNKYLLLTVDNYIGWIPEDI